MTNCDHGYHFGKGCQQCEDFYRMRDRIKLLEEERQELARQGDTYRDALWRIVRETTDGETMAVAFAALGIPVDRTEG